MKTELRTLGRRILSAVLAVLWIASGVFSPAAAAAEDDTVGRAQTLVDGILTFKCGESSPEAVQRWIDGGLTEGAGGSSEWYVLGLSQSGAYDFSRYAAALADYVENNRIPSATTREKYALILLAAGGGDGYARQILAEAAGKQGVMSWIYGLHLLNNGVGTEAETAEAVETLCGLECAGGGWTIMGDVADTDVTAMTLQALAPHLDRPEVKAAADRAVDLLAGRQREDGDCIGFGGALNPESTAQVITALSALGIDCMTDGRFFSGGKSLFDGLEKYRLPDGSFCHAVGDGTNDSATVQVFYTCVAYLRMKAGAGSLYLLNGPIVPEESPSTDPTGEETPEPVPEPEVAEPVPEPETAEPIPEPEEAEPVLPEAVSEPVPDPSVSAETVPETEAGEAEPEPEPGDGDPRDGSPREESADEREAAPAKPAKAAGGYKKWAYLGVGAAGILVCVLLFCLGKRNPKNFMAVALFVAAGMAFVRFTDFQSVETYYTAAAEKEDAVGTITLTIRCDTVAGRTDSELIPADGVILPLTEFAIREGETAYDLLTEAARANGIQMESRGSGGMIYVAGIAYLYEYDFGDLSGWMYRVNGEQPSVGSDSFRLSDGDFVEWLYSCEIGNDLN